MTLITALSFLSTAQAAEGSDADIYVRGRASVAMPANVVGIAAPVSLGMGARFESGHALGLRAMYLSNPPDTFYAEPGPWGAGLVFDYAWYGAVSPRVDIYPTLSFGVLMAVDETDGTNIVLPVSETGLGMQFKLPTSGGSQVTVAPEVGLVPLLVAPYAAINVGMLFPA